MRAYPLDNEAAGTVAAQTAEGNATSTSGPTRLNRQARALLRVPQIVPEDEWDTFVGELWGYLPSMSRVTESRQYVLQKLCWGSTELTAQNSDVPQWARVAVQRAVEVLRQPPKKFHPSLVFEIEVNISRQEAECASTARS